MFHFNITLQRTSTVPGIQIVLRNGPHRGFGYAASYCPQEDLLKQYLLVFSSSCWTVLVLLVRNFWGLTVLCTVLCKMLGIYHAALAVMQICAFFINPLLRGPWVSYTVWCSIPDLKVVICGFCVLKRNGIYFFLITKYVEICFLHTITDWSFSYQIGRHHWFLLTKKLRIVTFPCAKLMNCYFFT